MNPDYITIGDPVKASPVGPGNAPEQMPSERNCVCDSYVHLDGYSGGAAKEGLYGALWVVAEGVRKKYVLAPEQSRGTAQEQPAWHDAPTVEGVWLNSINRRSMLIWKHELATWGKTGARWFGPIQPDSGDKP